MCLGSNAPLVPQHGSSTRRTHARSVVRNDINCAQMQSKHTVTDDTGRAARDRVSGELTLEKAFGEYTFFRVYFCDLVSKKMNSLFSFHLNSREGVSLNQRPSGASGQAEPCSQVSFLLPLRHEYCCCCCCCSCCCCNCSHISSTPIIQYCHRLQ